MSASVHPKAIASNLYTRRACQPATFNRHLLVISAKSIATPGSNGGNSNRQAKHAFTLARPEVA